MINKVILVGHLGRDPEASATAAGGRIVRFSVATSETWRDKATGERRQATEWHQVVVFNEGLAKVAEQYLKKGSKVYVEGANRTRKWTGQDGKERYTTEVVLGAFRGQLALLDRAERPPEASDESAYGQAPADSQAAARSRADDLDDDIPF